MVRVLTLSLHYGTSKQDNETKEDVETPAENDEIKADASAQEEDEPWDSPELIRYEDDDNPERDAGGEMEPGWNRINAVISDAESGVEESGDQSECGTDDNDHDADESDLTTNGQNAAKEDDRHAGPTWESSNVTISSG